MASTSVLSATSYGAEILQSRIPFSKREGADPDAGADDPSADRQRLISPCGIHRIVDGEVAIATSSEAVY